MEVVTWSIVRQQSWWHQGYGKTFEKLWRCAGYVKRFVNPAANKKDLHGAANFGK